jgi:hypothetical protein
MGNPGHALLRMDVALDFSCVLLSGNACVTRNTRVVNNVVERRVETVENLIMAGEKK